MELVLVRELCGVFCISMQFVVFIELVGTLVLPTTMSFTLYVVIISIVKKPTPVALPDTTSPYSRSTSILYRRDSLSLELYLVNAHLPCFTPNMELCFANELPIGSLIFLVG